MYEDLTPEEIKSEILGRMDTELDTREGGYTNDMISGIAYEQWKVYQSLDAVIPMAFIDETSGEYIDKRCGEYGIVRKAGTAATAILTFIGTDGTVIPKGKVFLTANGLEFTTDGSVTISGGEAWISATAVEVGEQYNVPMNTITGQYVNLAGLTSVTNAAAHGGTESETDTALLNRYYAFLQKPSTSGNANEYKQWATAVDGVGNAKIYSLWDGPGTVKVLIVGDDNDPVDEIIRTRCADYIETVRPIGATVTVESAEALVINVDAAVTHNSNITIDTIQAALETALGKYLKDIAFTTYTVPYNRIAYMLLDIEGVIDYTLLTVNADTENIVIGTNQVPVLGTVVVTDAN